MTYKFRKNIALNFRPSTIFLCLRSRLGNSVFVMAAIYFHTTKNLRTDITVVEIAVHLPIDETFSECIKYKIRKKKDFSHCFVQVFTVVCIT